ncbi:MAG: hypothetical protein IJ040_08525 [Lachnospiraceae bacterium]|nr:hypothetical protein [Lachnospiraceae bacterium]
MEHNERLFIPQGMKAEIEYFEGFGKRELRRAIYGSIGVVIITLVLWLFMNHTIYAVAVLLFGETGVVALVTRSQATNLSAIDSILLIIRYYKEQQHFRYKKRKEKVT